MDILYRFTSLRGGAVGGNRSRGAGTALANSLFSGPGFLDCWEREGPNVRKTLDSIRRHTMKDTHVVSLDLDLDIEVLDQREELLVAAAGTTCTRHVRDAIEVVTID
jgi:hypothetical protein